MEEAKKKKSLEPKTECCCCMCGDYGLSSELVQCQSCHFRSQHSYCSNLYPKAESYGICNWCLVHELDQKAAKHKTQNSKKNNIDRVMMLKIKKKKKKNDFDDQSIINGDDEIVGVQISGDVDHHHDQPPSGGSERVTDVGCGGGAKGRKPQVNVSSNKRGVRKMVRRYKFLDEVLASKLLI